MQYSLNEHNMATNHMTGHTAHHNIKTKSVPHHQQC